MIRVEEVLRQLEAYVQDELGAQGRLRAALQAQEAAIVGGDPRSIVERSKGLEQELTGTGERSRRRAELVRRCAEAWGLDASVLTFAAILERGGARGSALAQKRAELRRAAAGVQRQARRCAAAARLHQGLVAEVLGAVLGAGAEAGGAGPGRLVDAEV